MSANWGPDEVQHAVADYFDMLNAEIRHESFNKTAHRRRLQARLHERSMGSVERKHQNISAVLLEMHLPCIDGYKPLYNYQQRLREEVSTYLAKQPDLLTELARLAARVPRDPPTFGAAPAARLFEAPPARADGPQSRPWMGPASALRIDFARRDAENRRLGEKGEESVFEYEKQRLLRLRRDDLLRRVRWVSRDEGDGAGFDILSVDETTENDKLIEVKTTNLNKYFPFCVTANEVRCSEARPAEYHLYRVYDFSRQPRVYDLPGDLNRSCTLVPTTYRASFAR